jgi:hypothetical protein
MKSMKREEVLKLYNYYVKKFYRIIKVKNSTYNTQLNVLGNKLFGGKFVGVFSINTIPKNLKPGSFLITNTKEAEVEGEHWLAVVIGNHKTIYIYDTYGRKSKKLIPDAYKRAIGKGYKIKDSHYSAEQSITARSCGLRSIGFLKVVDEVGITNALKI